MSQPLSATPYPCRKSISGEEVDTTPDDQVEEVRDPGGHFGLREDYRSADLFCVGPELQLAQAPELLFLGRRAKKEPHLRTRRESAENFQVQPLRQVPFPLFGVQFPRDV